MGRECNGLQCKGQRVKRGAVAKVLIVERCGVIRLARVEDATGVGVRGWMEWGIVGPRWYRRPILYHQLEVPSYLRVDESR